MKTYTEPSSMALGNFYFSAEKFAAKKMKIVEGSGRHTGSDALTDSLYQHLELHVLLESIAAGLKKRHAIEAISFRSFEQSHHFESKCLSDFRSYCKETFTILHDAQLLGSLSLYRCRQFSSEERSAIMALVEHFGGPVKNALLYKKACYAASHDALTGVYNRAALHSILADKLASHRGQGLVLLICDLDGFKSINDNYGHAVGDQVLKLFAGSLKSAVRENDLVFRYGGDEFVIALTNATEKSSRVLAEKIRLSIRQSKLYIKRNCIKLSTTIGVTELRAADSLADVISRADQAMLRGKKSGKNRVVCDSV